MKFILISILYFAAAQFFFSCNKTKQNAKTLEGTTWSVTSLNINGIADTALPTLDFGEGDIYKQILVGKWHNAGIKQSLVAIDISFAWQFRDKGKTFEISNQTEGLDALQCSQLSGIYSVSSASKTEYEFTSNATIGFAGKKVVFKIKKQ